MQQNNPCFRIVRVAEVLCAFSLFKSKSGCLWGDDDELFLLGCAVWVETECLEP
jgi:hypothetical protein